MKATKDQGKECIYIQNFDDIKKHLQSEWQPGDLVITMGAGDVDQQTYKFFRLKSKHKKSSHTAAFFIALNLNIKFHLFYVIE